MRLRPLPPLPRGVVPRGPVVDLPRFGAAARGAARPALGVPALVVVLRVAVALAGALRAAAPRLVAGLAAVVALRRVTAAILRPVVPAALRVPVLARVALVAALPRVAFGARGLWGCDAGFRVSPSCRHPRPSRAASGGAACESRTRSQARTSRRGDCSLDSMSGGDFVPHLGIRASVDARGLRRRARQAWIDRRRPASAAMPFALPWLSNRAATGLGGGAVLACAI